MKRQQGFGELVFLLVLAASMLANAWLWRVKNSEHDARTAAETSFKTQREATQTCNASIAGLEQAAEARGRSAEKSRQAAAARRKKANEQADKELSTPASTPGNDCKSATDRVHRILSERKKP